MDTYGFLSFCNNLLIRLFYCFYVDFYGMFAYFWDIYPFSLVFQGIFLEALI